MRKLATAALSFSAAIFLAQYLVPSSWTVRCCVLFAILSLIGFLFKTNVRLRILLICLGLAFGFLWSALYASIFYAPAQKLAGKTASVSAVVAGYPEETDYGAKLLVSIRTGGVSDVKTQLYIYDGIPDVKPGNTIDFSAAFRTADIIYGERTESFLSKGIFLLASLKGELTVTGTSEPAAYFPARMAHALAQRIAQIFPKDSVSFIEALILGNTAGIYKDQSLSAALSATGTSHIISVSGMNIAFLMGFLGLFIKNKRVLTAVGIPVILLFISVVGFMPPVVRAGVMQVFLLVAPLFRRESDPVTSLSAALMLILLSNPFSAGSAGLHLSFSATLGILLFTERIYMTLDEPLRKRPLYKYRIPKALVRFVIGSLATTAGALIISVPLIALHFGTVSLIAPITNIFILLPVTLAFCGGIIAVIFGFLYAPAGCVLAFIAALPARYILIVIKSFSHIPFASVYTSNPAVVIWLVYVYMLLITVFALRVKLRQFLYPVCLSAVSLCLILLLTTVFSSDYKLSVTALDVGQGQSIVITSGKYTAVVDCGSASGKNAGDIVTKYLRSRGRTSIDLLILTHFHSDHANGVTALLERMKVTAIAAPDPSIDSGELPADICELAAEKGTDINKVTENLIAGFGHAVIMLYAPIGSDDENERGLSVLCSEDGFDVLITGDMSSEIERRLVAAVPLPDIELLVIGHHGSKYSTSDALLDAVTPETAAISVGYNSYGHPAPETLKKLALNGIMVYRTDEDGNVTINGW